MMMLLMLFGGDLGIFSDVSRRGRVDFQDGVSSEELRGR
jgi:hypothetical protein